jgi:hypothetical protein
VALWEPSRAAVAAVGTSIASPGLGIALAGLSVLRSRGRVREPRPAERVKHYEQGTKEGGILMGVRARSVDDEKYLSETGEPSGPSTSIHSSGRSRCLRVWS